MSVFGSRRRIIELIEIRYRLKHREKNIQIKRDTHSEEIQVGGKNTKNFGHSYRNLKLRFLTSVSSTYKHMKIANQQLFTQ